jgi:hypothetical protein
MGDYLSIYLRIEPKGSGAFMNDLLSTVGVALRLVERTT